MDSALRPMSTSQVLDRTFSLYRSNFALFAGIALVAPALTLISRVVQLWIFGSPFLGRARVTPQMAQALLTRTLIGFLVAIVVYLVGSAIASAATVYAVSMVHLGKPANIPASYASVKPLFRRILGLIISVFFIAVWPLVPGYALLLGLVFGERRLKGLLGVSDNAFAILAVSTLFCALVACIIWWTRIYCRYALCVAACALEKLPVRYSLRRSKFLTKGSLWRVFVIYLLSLLLGLVLTNVLQSPALIASRTFFLTVRSQVSLTALLWIYIAEFLGGTLAGPIATVAMALLYYDERVRKEAFDLQLMMQTITPQITSQAAASGAGSL
jgi:hypothetical protein